MIEDNLRAKLKNSCSDLYFRLRQIAYSRKIHQLVVLLDSVYRMGRTIDISSRDHIVSKVKSRVNDMDDHLCISAYDCSVINQVCDVYNRNRAYANSGKYHAAMAPSFIKEAQELSFMIYRVYIGNQHVKSNFINQILIS